MAYPAYVVFKGLNPGVYTSWQATQAQVNGYRGAVFKKFESIELAQQAYSEYTREDVTASIPSTVDIPRLHEAYPPRGDPWSRFRMICYMFMTFHVIEVLCRYFF